MGKWLKIDAQRTSRPEFCKVSAWGFVVYQAILEICAYWGNDGALTSEFWTPKYLAYWTRFEKEKGGIRGITAGMKNALDTGIVTAREDGSFYIPGWHEADLYYGRGSRGRTRIFDRDVTVQGYGSTSRC